MSQPQAPRPPAGYLGLADAAECVARMRKISQQRARLKLTQALRGGQVEVVTAEDGKLELVGGAELAAAELDFTSGRMRRSGNQAAADADIGPTVLLRLDFSETPAPAGEPRKPRPPAGDIRWPEPADEAEARRLEDRMREVMEEAAGSYDYTPPAAARQNQAHGDEFGPLVYLLPEDVRAIALPPPAAAPPPPAAASRAAIPESAGGGRPPAYDRNAAEEQVWRRCHQHGLPAARKELVDEILEWFLAQGQNPSRRWAEILVHELWPKIENLGRPAEIGPSGGDRKK